VIWMLAVCNSEAGKATFEGPSSRASSWTSRPRLQMRGMRDEDTEEASFMQRPAGSSTDPPEPPPPGPTEPAPMSEEESGADSSSDSSWEGDDAPFTVTFDEKGGEVWRAVSGPPADRRGAPQEFVWGARACATQGCWAQTNLQWIGQTTGSWHCVPHTQQIEAAWDVQREAAAVAARAMLALADLPPGPCASPGCNRRSTWQGRYHTWWSARFCCQLCAQGSFGMTPVAHGPWCAAAEPAEGQQAVEPEPTDPGSDAAVAPPSPAAPGVGEAAASEEEGAVAPVQASPPGDGNSSSEAWGGWGRSRNGGAHHVRAAINPSPAEQAAEEAAEVAGAAAEEAEAAALEAEAAADEAAAAAGTTPGAEASEGAASSSSSSSTHMSLVQTSYE
jgi:hypothetical protein